MSKNRELIIKEIISKIKLMGFDYDRFSSSGQELYEEIEQLIKELYRGENKNVL